MTERDTGERTVGGLVGKAVGKAKEALGGSTANRELAREGRLQQVQSDAGQARNRRAQKTERQRLRSSQQREARVEAQIEEQEARERLPGVPEQAKALQEQEVAVAQADEARRMGEAAARVKDERKQDRGTD